MSKLTLECKMEITGVKIVPVITPDYGFKKGNPVDGAPLGMVMSIKMFNEMIELYNEKHKDDHKKPSLKGSLGDVLLGNNDILNKERCK